MLRYKPFIPILGGIHLLEFLQNSTLTIILHNELVRGNELKLGDTLIKTSASGKDNKDKSEQNQSKPTRNGKGKTRVKNESQNQSRISPIQQEKKANESQRTNVDKPSASSITSAATVNVAVAYNLLSYFLDFIVKTVNGEQQLQALVDGKNIIITEATVRRDLQLEDANGVDCLPNATIFEQLTLMGNTMASAIICLATNQKFNFSKYIFESMVKNLDNAVKFLIYPRFVQVFLNNQLEGMATHNRIYIVPSHTKKIFANMRRQGKDFSGRVAPLFPTMVVQAQEEMGDDSAMPTDPHYAPIITQPSSS
ncbi:hypothetical protein Tco_1523816 [Tanacetum coccineum]